MEKTTRWDSIRIMTFKRWLVFGFVAIFLTACQTTPSKSGASSAVAVSECKTGINQAETLLASQKAEQALTLLNKCDSKQLSSTDASQLFKLKAKAYGLSKNWLQQAYAYLDLEKLLTNSAEIKTNRQAIWSTLMHLSPQALDLGNPNTPPDEASGWFSLAYAIKAYQNNPAALNAAIADWRRSYPNHPADPSFYIQQSSDIDLPSKINNIAVLLPVNGPYAVAANAIKEGIQAAANIDHTTSHIQFFDIHSVNNQNDVLEQYQNAINANADIVIGPLQKQSVSLIASLANRAIPVLALNHLESETPVNNLFQFGLTPNDDVRALVKYAKARGLSKALVLSPQGDWGTRMQNLFTSQWLENDGQIMDIGRYNPQQNDFSNVLVPLLKVKKSKKKDVTPTRRHDIDVLFLAASPLKARQLIPQLKFNYSGRLPLLATSQAYSGIVNLHQDIDLNNLIIADIPWVYPNARQEPVYQALLLQHNNGLGSLTRLYALGIDAFRLLPQLMDLQSHPETQYVGETGRLSLLNNGQIQRDVTLGKFRNGTLQAFQQ